MTFCGIEIRESAAIPDGAWAFVNRNGVLVGGGNVDTGETWCVPPNRMQDVKVAAMICRGKILDDMLENFKRYDNVGRDFVGLPRHGDTV